MCQKCEDLQERVAWLESELGLQRDARTVELIRASLPRDKSPGRRQAAEMIAALYRASGRPLTPLQLMEAIPPRDFAGEDDRDPKIVSVWVCVARKSLGKAGIGNAWSRGYYLTEAGMAKVAAILGHAAPMGRAA